MIVAEEDALKVMRADEINELVDLYYYVKADVEQGRGLDALAGVETALINLVQEATASVAIGKHTRAVATGTYLVVIIPEGGSEYEAWKLVIATQPESLVILD
jgi:hypothetical protein